MNGGADHELTPSKVIHIFVTTVVRKSTAWTANWR